MNDFFSRQFISTLNSYLVGFNFSVILLVGVVHARTTQYPDGKEWETPLPHTESVQGNV